VTPTGGCEIAHDSARGKPHQLKIMRKFCFLTSMLFVLVTGCGQKRPNLESAESPEAGLDSGTPAGSFDASVLDADTLLDASGLDSAASRTEAMDASHHTHGEGGAGGSGGDEELGVATGGVEGSRTSAGNGGSGGSAGASAGSGAGSGGSIGAGSGGSVAEAGGNAGSGGSNASAGAGGSPASTCSGPPGLYADDQCSVLAPGVRLYTPQFQLWSDGAIKTRYVYLPPNAAIDASGADHWQFPVGTRLYKEFRSADGAQRIETRLLEKTVDSNSTLAWNFDTYVWSADQKSVHVEVNGVTNALGSGLDVPTRKQCTECHNHSGFPRDMVNGFQAIQLNWPGAGVTLQSLVTDGTLTNSRADIATAAVIPGRNATEIAAFGYLHANCGHCHTLNEDAPHYLTLLTSVGVPLAQQLAWTTTVCFYPHTPTESYATQRVAVGRPSNSAVYNRASVRGAQSPAATPVDAGPALDPPDDSIQMPPIATHAVDDAAMIVVSDWISSLSGCTP
jgi:hypothetical protein